MISPVLDPVANLDCLKKASTTLTEWFLITSHFKRNGIAMFDMTVNLLLN